jgi:hypothetical protein
MATLEAIKWYFDNTQQVSRSFRPQGDSEYDAPQSSPFWGSVMPAMMRGAVEQMSQIGIG